MRPEFKSLLSDLETAHTRVERRINERIQTFNFPKKNIGTDRDSLKNELTRFFWSLFCPEIPMESNYAQHKNMVWSTLIAVTKKEYGPTAEVSILDLASSGAEGGLRNLFHTTANCLKDYFQQNQAEARVCDYWNTHTDQTKIQDAQDYIKAFQHYLPIDQIDAGAIRMIANFRKVLVTHPQLMESKRNFRR